ncbi:GGDEF domain-containing protein [Pseudomonas knackmussii]|uniref:diguanylate cyclase n=1 Tax=Pseudomonas knackmussii TaxID=65741 RepID=A0ABY4KVH3_9PSED|nr:GGDEF domain-containing protein [Pseudomonas knackmussii]UPQ84435.1 GGDEF domain-containing protein [Pseudomonas knackmussii]
MLPDKQDNTTVDIETARLRRETGNAKPMAALQRSLSEVQRDLSARLQTSLEIDRLLGFFLNEIRGLAPVSGLTYRHSDTDFQLTIGEAEGFALSHPLSHQADCLGELILFSHDRFSDVAFGQLEDLIGSLLFPVRNALLYRRAVQASLKDPLTGVGNRVALEQSLARETELTRRHGQPMSIVMLDMDHFKNLNDSHGHQAGDAALKATALLLKEQLRNVDMVFRFGGEEFILVLSNTSTEAAAVVAERIRAAIQNLRLLVGDKQVRLSASLGYGTYKQCESQEDLLRRVDQALYQAKREGRNRMQAASV